MALVTKEIAQQHIQEHCSEKIDIHLWSQREPVATLCGCGYCPRPDPTPEEYVQNIESMIWNRIKE